LTDEKWPVLQIAETKKPGDPERCEAAGRAIYAVCDQMRELGPVAILDGLISVYCSLAIQWIGVAQADNALRKTRKNLPRTAAAIRAAKEKSGGSA
jgi:hypothetical protein